ncbi:glutamine--fructose-6-phosphate transaminase (isomerizing) [Candidatus Bathyarchaeota archaeon]|nr:glutamine--fructose-6-phosphate transaminase (isomerizing) [Candidatus Bathyarchaeota archaeon]
MCGIAGYIGLEEASKILLASLKSLEYRGYDSCGMATVFNSQIIVKKDVGKVDEVNLKLNFTQLPGNIGVAHTRWGTHGAITKENAHPHLSNNKEIAVVHNGIIENYEELKNTLKNEGFKFFSETDTEVIPNLIELEMRSGKSFEKAAIEAVKKLEGSYAILAIHANERKIIAARSKSPLVIGVGENFYFAASDIPAFLKYTKKVVYLHDKDLAVLSNHQLKIYNLNENKEVKREVYTIDWSLNQVEKGDFNHFMIKEILEQVETIQKAVEQNEEVLFEVAEEVKNASKIFLVACGSSYHACLIASYLLSKISKIYAFAILASELSNYLYLLNKDTLVIAVSQSGETADVLEAVDLAKKKGGKVISIVNIVGSSLYRNSDKSLLMRSGPEISVLSTKTYTSQLAIFLLIAYTIAGKYEEGKRKLKYLWNVIYNLTSETTRNYIKKLAEKLKNEDHIFLIGRGLSYPTALEAALKIKEVAYIHAEGFAGGELKHGPIALIEKNTPCIVFISKDTEKEILANVMEVKSRGGYIIGVASEKYEPLDFLIKVPDVNDANPICQIIPIQILAYQLALLRGLDPDKPRNLAKSVTVK